MQYFKKSNGISKLQKKFYLLGNNHKYTIHTHIFKIFSVK